MLAAQLTEWATIKNSYATGQVSGGAVSVVGGLVGLSDLSSVVNSYANVAVSGGDGAKAVGGLVGDSEGACPPCHGSIVMSYAAGNVSGGDGASVGGLVGENGGGAISNSYAAGTSQGGNGAFAGGLVGANEDRPQDDAIPTISESYSTGRVAGGSESIVGGLIGSDTADAQNSDDYWDLDTSGISDPAQGAGNVANDPGITGLTTEQFISGLPAGFSTSIWKEKAKIDGGFPYLIADPPPK